MNNTGRPNVIKGWRAFATSPWRDQLELHYFRLSLFLLVPDCGVSALRCLRTSCYRADGSNDAVLCFHLLSKLASAEKQNQSRNIE